jgi:glycosyltransferase involved in cell wall biosynthesis
MNNTGSSPFQDLDLILQLIRLYGKIKPKIALHFTVKPNIYGSLVAGYFGIPSISTISGLGTVFLTSATLNKVVRFLYKVALKYPARVFFQNPDDLKVFQQGQLLTRSNYGLIPGSGVDIRRFKPSKPPAAPPFVFLMMARLIEEKGIREYIEAAANLKAKGLAVKCLLLGTPEPNHKRGIPVKEITRGPVEYLGEVKDVKGYIENAHAVVLPSYGEGLPKSLLEAAAMEKPIIASNVPGCIEVVKEEINGLLCKPGDVADLEEKMEKMLDYSPQKLVDMGRTGRSLVKESFTEEKVVQVYMDAIKEIT